MDALHARHSTRRTAAFSVFEFVVMTLVVALGALTVSIVALSADNLPNENAGAGETTFFDGKTLPVFGDLAELSTSARIVALTVTLTVVFMGGLLCLTVVTEAYRAVTSRNTSGSAAATGGSPVGRPADAVARRRTAAEPGSPPELLAYIFDGISGDYRKVLANYNDLLSRPVFVNLPRQLSQQRVESGELQFTLGRLNSHLEVAVRDSDRRTEAQLRAQIAAAQDLVDHSDNSERACLELLATVLSLDQLVVEYLHAELGGSTDTLAMALSALETIRTTNGYPADFGAFIR